MSLCDPESSITTLHFSVFFLTNAYRAVIYVLTHIFIASSGRLVFYQSI